MLGRAEPVSLPEHVTDGVKNLLDKAVSSLGPVRIEWCFDGRDYWVMQLQRGAAPGADSVIYPGEPHSFRLYDPADGLEGLRRVLDEVASTGEGIILTRSVGITSHFGDVLRRARVPSRILLTG